MAPQDVRATFISTLTSLAVGSVTLNSAYWSDRFTTVLPAVFVREIATETTTDISNTAEIDSGVYDLLIVAIDSPTVTAETFVASAATAINTAIKAVKNDFGGAYALRRISTHDLETEWVDGVNVHIRVLTYRAESAS